MVRMIEIDGPQRVYFVRMGALIKIGYTAALKQRMAALKDIMPFAIELLHSIPGDRFAEAYYHSRFAHLRMKGEWFQIAPELLDHIKELREQTMPDGKLCALNPTPQPIEIA